MKKIYVIITVLVLLIGSTIFYFYSINKNNNEVLDSSKSNAQITTDENLTFEYYETVLVSDHVTIENGELNDIDIILDTTQLGEISFEYIYQSEGKDYKDVIKYEVVDTTAPLVLSSGSYTYKKGSDINLVEKIFCADNYDSKPNCEIIGDYDFNTSGTYNLKLSATDSSGNNTTNSFNLIIKDTITSGTYTPPAKLPIEDVISKHKNENTRIGIDVSRWQEEIDWQKVKDSGVEFVILRIGYGWDEEHTLDPMFEEYLEGAKSVGLDIGIYYYSYANSVEEAVHAANWIVDTLDGEKLDLPISFDWEEWSEFNTYEISLTELNNMAIEFIKVVENAGYKGMNYGSANYLRQIWDVPQYPTWLAHYVSDTTYEGDYYMWQLSNTGIVDGIAGDVDLNVLYEN